ncbi:MAG: hypothetical protein GY760_01405 [Deltaproteobacteria bacterium]|nr:hypothetical protein [Deltaproteobacteria bacterium]
MDNQNKENRSNLIRFETKDTSCFGTIIESSIDEIAKLYPLLAYGLSRNQILIKFLGNFEKLLNEKNANETEFLIMNNLKLFMLDESFIDLESDLLKLSSFSGFNNKKKTKTHIKKINKKIANMPDDMFDNYIEKVIEPAINVHGLNSKEL